MLKSLNQRGITPIIIIIIILGGLVCATYLIQQQTNFFPQAKNSEVKKAKENKKQQKTEQKKALQAVKEANKLLKQSLRSQNEDELITAGAYSGVAVSLSGQEYINSLNKDKTNANKKNKAISEKSGKLSSLAFRQAKISQKLIQKEKKKGKLRDYAESLSEKAEAERQTAESLLESNDFEAYKQKMEQLAEISSLEGAARAQADVAENKIAFNPGSHKSDSLLDKLFTLIVPEANATHDSSQQAGSSYYDSHTIAAEAREHAAAASFNLTVANYSGNVTQTGIAYDSYVSAQTTASYASTVEAALDALASADTPEETQAAIEQAQNALAQAEARGDTAAAAALDTAIGAAQESLSGDSQGAQAAAESISASVNSFSDSGGSIDSNSYSGE